VIAIVCQHEHTKKNGVTKSGAVRLRCKDCGKSWTESTAALGGMRIGMDRAERIIGMLCEGMSVRATCRLTGTDMETVLDLLVMVGQQCEAYMAENIKGVAVEDIQMDEQWQFVLCKKATAKKLKYVGGVGDCWSFTAIERSTKLVVAWHMGKRNEQHTTTFIKKLAAATTGRFHLSSDGWTAYPMAVWQNLEDRVDYGMLIKIFADGSAEDRRRYSPAKIVQSKKSRVLGIPEGKRICTSHVERLNGSVRTFCKRMGRLTYCFSKKWNNHRAALALFFCHYNYCRAHKSLKGETPAMAHGLTNQVWTVRDLIEKVSAA
jgi:IS1 family transposase/transposase-like protein